MTTKQWFATLSAGGIALLTACAPEPAPQVIYAQPTFDKLGNPSCRPGNVPIGGAYTADLPLCSVISGMPAAGVVPAIDTVDDNGSSVTPDTPDDDPTGGNQNQNQNNQQTQNNNQNQNNQQTGN